MPNPPKRAEPGELRRRILDASVELLEGEGLAALSMREVARRAGVTHQAPYHHFADRESILAELVADGFAELARRLAAANALPPPAGPRQMLMASGAAYVGYAREHPGVFRIMFRPEVVDASRFPAACNAADAAYAQLRRMVVLVHGRDDDLLATMHWSLVHGLAGLMIDGGLAEKMPGEAARQSHVADTLGRYAERVVSDAEERAQAR